MLTAEVQEVQHWAWPPVEVWLQLALLMGPAKPPAMAVPTARIWLWTGHSALRKLGFLIINCDVQRCQRRAHEGCNGGGGGEAHWLMKFQTFVELGRRPVVKELRLGEHTASWPAPQAVSRERAREARAGMGRGGAQ